METVTLNFRGKVRRVVENGKTYLVAPLSMIVPGVLPGSQGPLYYPPEEIARNVKGWNGVPMTIGHPMDPLSNEHISAQTEGVWERQGLGEVRNAGWDGKRLKGEGWFDEERTRSLEPRIHEALVKSKPMELSTGLHTRNEVADNGASYNGRPYTHVARAYKPDHLAILTDQVGACSLKDGCGLNVNARGQAMADNVLNVRLSQFVDVSSLRPGETLERVETAEGWRWLIANQSRHQETGQYLNTAGASHKQVHAHVKKGAGATDTPVTSIDPEAPIDNDRDEDEPWKGEKEEKGKPESPPPHQHGDRKHKGTDNAADLNDQEGTMTTTNVASIEELPQDARKAAFAAMDEQGGKSSGAARAATKNADEKGTAASHKKAAAAHREAAEHHEDAGNDELKAGHAKMAKQHAAKARNLTGNTREGMLSRLTANCSCAGDKAAFNAMSDDLLRVLNAKMCSNDKDKKDDEDEEDEEDMEGNAGESTHAFDNGAKGSAAQSGGKGTKEEYNANAAPITARLTPAELEVWNSAADTVRQSKHALVARLVANIADPQERNKIGNDFMKKPIAELKTLVRCLPTVHNAFDPEPEPIFTGAAGAPTVNASYATDDILELPVMNYASEE